MNIDRFSQVRHTSRPLGLDAFPLAKRVHTVATSNEKLHNNLATVNTKVSEVEIKKEQTDSIKIEESKELSKKRIIDKPNDHFNLSVVKEKSESNVSKELKKAKKSK